MSTGVMGRLHSHANLNVVRYGGTLRRSGNSIRATVSGLHGSNRTGTTGGTNGVTTSNTVVVTRNRGGTFLLRIGYRASFITGSSDFGTFTRGITDVTLRGGIASITTVTRLPCNSNRAIRRTHMSLMRGVNRGVRVHHIRMLRNTGVTTCHRNLHVNMIMSCRNNDTSANGGLTVRVTTFGPITISSRGITTSMLTHRGSVVRTGTGRSNGPSGVIRGVVGLINISVSDFVGSGELMPPTVGRTSLKMTGVATYYNSETQVCSGHFVDNLLVYC